MSTQKQRTATIEKADIEAGAAAMDWGGHPVRVAAGAVSKLADQPQLITFSAGVIVAGALRRDLRMVRTGTRMLAAHLLATAVKSAIKARLDRTRPKVADEHGYARGEGTGSTAPLNSFPSGHTAGAMAVARAVSREYPQLAGPALAATAAVGLLQPLRGAHYPIDVLAGAIVGFAAEAALAAAVSLSPAPPSADPPSPSAPS